MVKKVSKLSTVKKTKGFNKMELGLFMLAFAIVGLFTLWVSFAAPVSGGACTITPSQVVLDQVWNVNASGLPTKGVNMVLTFPDGGQSTGPITVNADGTYFTTGNSNMSASWGFIAPEQTGTYNYKFVNRIKWPAGTYTRTYASCSVVVS